MRIITFKELKTLKGIPFSREHIRRLEVGGKSPNKSVWLLGVTATVT